MSGSNFSGSNESTENQAGDMDCKTVCSLVDVSENAMMLYQEAQQSEERGDLSEAASLYEQLIEWVEGLNIYTGRNCFRVCNNKLAIFVAASSAANSVGGLYLDEGEVATAR